MALFGCCEVTSPLLYITGTCLLLYLYGKWRNRVFHNTGIPGPEPDIFIGNLRLMAKLEGYSVTDNVLRKQYGDVFGMYIGSTPFVNVYDQDIIKEVLVKNFQNFPDRWDLDLNPYPVDMGLLFAKGAAWQRLRNILSPTFTAGKLRIMCDHINTASQTLTNKLVKSAEKKEIVDVKELFGGFTMDAIASTAFGIQVDSQQDQNNPFVTYAKKLFFSNFFAHPGLVLATLFPGLRPLLRLCGVSVFPKDAVQFFMKTVHQTIEERRQQPAEEQKKNKDFLQLMLNAEDTNNPAQSGEQDGPQNSKKMTTDEIFAQAFFFFAAGYETTATTLQYIAYALSTNPEVLQKLTIEIDSVIGDDEPTYDNIQKLKYLDNVIQETLRMYPPVPGLTRVTKETVNIKGYTFPAGAVVAMSSLLLHRDPDLYPDPHTFNPDRWDGKEKMPSTWLPFGYGPRLCIGMRLAQVELKIVLIHILRRVKFVRLPDTPDFMEFKTSGVLAPRDPIKLRVEFR